MNRLEVDLGTGESNVIPLAQDEIDAALARSAAEQARQTAEDAKARLRDIDAASIRALREWIAQRPDAPQFVKDREAEAVTEREKLK